MAKTSRLNLKSRSEFAALSLHDKNEYIQGIAQQIAHIREEGFTPLNKEALSRIRRYYSRRSFADLRLEELPDDGLKTSLLRLAEAIRADEVTKVISHELPVEPKPIVRAPPLNDAQLSFFVPTVHDAPIKDDFNLMDIAPFALSKTTGEGVIR